jgi:hypothetical protein
MTNKTIFAFPYHDPQGKFNHLIEKHLSDFNNIFSKICVSATPVTIEKNTNFIKKLEQTGFNIFKNPVNSNIGDHYRNALATAVKESDV